MAVWGGSNMGTGNWKLGADLKRISFVKNVVEAHGRFRSVDLVRYIKTGSSQCAAICVLEFRKSKNVSIFGTSRPRSSVGRWDPGRWKFGSSPRRQQSLPLPAFGAALRSLSHCSRYARRVMQYSSGGGDARRGSSHRR